MSYLQKNHASSWWYALLIGASALLLNLLFLWYGSGSIYHTITQAHAHVGYALYTKNSCWMSNELRAIERQQQQPETFVDYHNCTADNSMIFDRPFPVNDTIGYGVVLGLLWKITHSLALADVQYLQIILYLISLYFIFHIALLFFDDRHTAWCATVSHLLFLPLIALNVQAVRDVWAYYGTVVLVWGVLSYLHGRFLWPRLLVVGAVVGAVQWVRPTLFLAVVLLMLALVLLGLMRRYAWSAIITAAAIMALTNGLVFWLPFMAYNKAAYGRLLVGPVGQDLLEGLGEFDNPWGHQLSDEYVAQLIHNRYGLTYGTPEFDDKALHEFKKDYAQHPTIYWRNSALRIPGVILPGLPWLFPAQSLYQHASGLKQKLGIMVSSWRTFFDALARHLLIRIFLLLGYIGMALAWYRGHTTAVVAASAVVVAGLGKLPSHIEYRYLVPFYWVIGLFVGYLWVHRRLVLNYLRTKVR